MLWLLLIFNMKKELEKTNYSDFIENLGKRAEIEELKMDKIEGEYKPIRVVNDYKKDLPIKVIKSNIQGMKLNTWCIQQVELGVIVIQFWTQLVLEEWAKGKITHRADKYTTIPHNNTNN
jgi:hypothetical protein